MHAHARLLSELGSILADKTFEQEGSAQDWEVGVAGAIGLDTDAVMLAEFRMGNFTIFVNPNEGRMAVIVRVE